MTGIVVVSHSRALADAAVALAQEMASGGEVRVEVAAGLVDGSFGTDAAAIAQAVERAADRDGAVVLMDLGSAVLSAEMALELLDPETADRVILSPAPLVEGLMLAVVAAAGGAPAARVAAEASGGLRAKQDHLGASPNAGASQPSAGEGGDATVTLELTTAHGLHARPAAKFVALAQESLEGEVESITARNATTGEGPVDADSMLGVLTLGGERGHRIEVSASGPGAEAALQRFVELNDDRFGESE
ncbi:HPr family phosphocarrier protein [Nocardioides rotundus]|nr:HPr family phosphocarrier protein [Nocardioides rotundus]